MEEKNNQYTQEIKRIYYPTVVMADLPNKIGMELVTYIRKEYKGQWYDILIKKVHHYLTGPQDMNKIRAELLEVFHKEVYFAQKLYRIDTLLLDNEGKPLHVPSKWCQISEETRLKEYYSLNINL